MVREGGGFSQGPVCGMRARWRKERLVARRSDNGAVSTPEYHIQCSLGDVGKYVLLPGDPGRCERIASRFDNPRLVAANREYTTYTGTLGGVPVSVTSTGIGGPSTAIAAEELGHLGAHTFIRVGTCGGIDKSLTPGDLVIGDSAVRNDGTSLQYLPLAYPASASFEVTSALVDAAKQIGARYHVGATVSNDAFYREGDAAEGTDPLAELRRGRILAAEMEAATLYTVARVRGYRAGAICMVSNIIAGEMPPPESLSLDGLIDTSVAALRLLSAHEAAAK